jgi:peptidoglycan hydrolase CwlO-like protein
VESELSRLKNKIKSTESTLESEIQNKEDIDYNLSKLNESIDLAADLVNKYDEQITAKEEEIAAKEKEIQSKYAEFETWIKMTYEDGDVNYLQMILSTNNFEDFLSSTEYVANIIDYQNRLMKELDSDLAALQQDKASLENDKTKKENAKASLEQNKAEVADLAEKSANYIANLQANQELYEAQKKDSEDQLKVLNKELETLLAKIAQQNAVYIGGVYQWQLRPNITGFLLITVIAAANFTSVSTYRQPTAAMFTLPTAVK